MSNNQTPAATPSSPVSAPPVPPPVAAAAAPEDALVRLAQIDIPAEQLRLKQAAQRDGVTPEHVMMELSGTVLSLVKDVARGLVETRDWSFASMNALAESTGDHLEAVEARLDIIEEFGGDTTILPDDAEVLQNVVASCTFLAKQLLQGPFPIEARDGEGQQKLAEVIALCEQANKIVSDSVLVSDDDDEYLDAADDELEPEPEPN